MKAKVTRNRTTGLVLGGLPRVNLLPPSVIEKRLQATLTRRWIIGFVASLLAVVAMAVAAQGVLATTQDALRAEQETTVQLTSELGSYSDVTKVITDRDDLTSFRVAAMGNDLDWETVFDAMSGQLPKGVSMTGFDLTAGANPVARQSRPHAVGFMGILHLWSTHPIDQDTVVDKLRTLDFMLDVSAATLAEDTDNHGYAMNVSVVVDQTVYTGKYAKEAGK